MVNLINEIFNEVENDLKVLSRAKELISIALKNLNKKDIEELISLNISIRIDNKCKCDEDSDNVDYYSNIKCCNCGSEDLSDVKGQPVFKSCNKCGLKQHIMDCNL